MVPSGKTQVMKQLKELDGIGNGRRVAGDEDGLMEV
jgi:hypothetical protein